MRYVKPPKKNMTSPLRLKWLLKKFYIFIVLALIYIPLIVVIFLSFNGQTGKGNVRINFGVPTAVNYLKLFNDNDFLNALANSAIISAIVVPISVIIATITCFGIWNANNKYINTIVGMSKVSIAIPEPITAISLALLFTTTIVPMGFDFGIFTICLAHICFCTPYAIISIFPKMQKMNRNLIWASYDLGYSKIKTFFKIVIPYLAPALLSAAAVTLAMSLDDFIITSLINGSCQTISTAIYSTRKGIKAWVVTFGALLVLVTFLIVLVVSIVKVKKNQKQKKMAQRRNYENN